ncbi:hypothetical protein [Xenorhabdus littoralis]|uniref:hypothetical protein n=1 Tax=Xenorhabdus littoralis TaxID=2582835 RepID=UPI0029E7FAD7|nr:hypothetical protein [Xenorhabdus sp. psl]MDX7992324.1 hypothetical protein [Xenorhabdus sp. psl]
MNDEILKEDVAETSISITGIIEKDLAEYSVSTYQSMLTVDDCSNSKCLKRIKDAQIITYNYSQEAGDDNVMLLSAENRPKSHTILRGKKFSSPCVASVKMDVGINSSVNVIFFELEANSSKKGSSVIFSMLKDKKNNLIARYLQDDGKEKERELVKLIEHNKYGPYDIFGLEFVLHIYEASPHIVVKFYSQARNGWLRVLDIPLAKQYTQFWDRVGIRMDPGVSESSKITTVALKTYRKIVAKEWEKNSQWHGVLTQLEDAVANYAGDHFTFYPIFGRPKNERELQERQRERYKFQQEISKANRPKRESIEVADGFVSGVFHAANTITLLKILSSSGYSEQEKYDAVINFVKLSSADATIYAAGYVEGANPYGIVSGKYGEIVKAYLKTGGCLLNTIFSCLTIAEGFSKADAAKIASGVIALTGGISSTALSGVVGFSVGQIFTALSLVFDGASGALEQAKRIEDFHKETILNKDNNKQFNYVWTSKSNQNGSASEQPNIFEIKASGYPAEKQVVGPENTPLFMRNKFAASTIITPKDAGSIDGVTYDTAPSNESSGPITSVFASASGFKGFKTSSIPDGRAPTHLIYTSSRTIVDPTWSKPNAGRDIINRDGKLLPGVMVVVSLSDKETEINGGPGDAVFYITGSERSVIGGDGFNLLIVKGTPDGETKLTYLGAENDSMVNDKTKVYGISSFFFEGDNVVVEMGDRREASIPVFMGKKGSKNVLRIARGPSPAETARVVQYGLQVNFGEDGRKYFTPGLNPIMENNRVIALAMNFAVDWV